LLRNEEWSFEQHLILHALLGHPDDVIAADSKPNRLIGETVAIVDIAHHGGFRGAIVENVVSMEGCEKLGRGQVATPLLIRVVEIHRQRTTTIFEEVEAEGESVGCAHRQHGQSRLIGRRIQLNAPNRAGGTEHIRTGNPNVVVERSRPRLSFITFSRPSATGQSNSQHNEA
jgi:hypothetical protein